MASTYTALGVELMATGENAGTWGTKTNTNLNIVEQIAGGYATQAVTDSGTPTALSVSDGSTGATLSHRVIEFTGSISGARVVTIPLDVQTFYIIKNSTSGAYTLQFKYASGSGDTVTWSATDKTSKIINATMDDGTNPNIKEITVGGLPGGSNTQVQFNDSGAFGADANLVWNSSTGLNIGSQKELRLQDTTGGEYVGLKSAGTATSYTMTLPAAVGSASQALVTTDGSGTLGFTSTSTFGITTGKAIAMAIVFG